MNYERYVAIIDNRQHFVVGIGNQFLHGTTATMLATERHLDNSQTVIEIRYCDKELVRMREQYQESAAPKPMRFNADSAVLRVSDKATSTAGAIDNPEPVRLLPKFPDNLEQQQAKRLAQVKDYKCSVTFIGQPVTMQMLQHAASCQKVVQIELQQNPDKGTGRPVNL